MNRRKWLALLMCLFAFAGVALGNNVFVLPDGIQSQTIQAFTNANPLTSAGSFAGPQGRPIDILPSPDSPVTYWSFGDASVDTVVAANQALTAIFRSGTSTAPARAAVVTPDGLYVLVVAGGLRIFDTAANEEIDLEDAPDVGVDPDDIAVSIDSQYAFVLSSASRRLTRVSLGDFTVAGTLNIAGQPTAVTVGPDGFVYVSATNAISVIDPDAMTALGSISVNGLPAKLYFTPDGKRAVAINRTPITNVTVWVVDPKTRTTTSIPATPSTVSPITMDDRVFMVSNERAILTSRARQSVYEVTLPPNLNLTAYDVGGNPLTEVKAVAVSDEFPPRNLFYIRTTGTTNTLNRVDLPGDTTAGSLAITGSAERLAFARAPSDAVGTAFIQYNNEQTIASTGTFQPIAIRVLDQQGRPVANQTVVFATTRAGVTFGTGSTTTNLEGLAITTVMHGTATGAIPVTATVGTSLTATYTLNVTGGGDGDGGGVDQPGGLDIFSGNGFLLQAGFLPQTLIVIVRDAALNPVPGAAVTWRIAEGLPTGLNVTQTVTDAEGKASVIFTPRSNIEIGAAPFVQQRIRATYQNENVDFWVTTYPVTNFAGQTVPSPTALLTKPTQEEGRTITGASGQTIPGALTVSVFTPSGARIPNVGLSATTELDPALGPIASCAGGFVLTDAQGSATCDLVLGGLPRSNVTMYADIGGSGPPPTGAFRRHFVNLNVTQPVATVVEIVSGNNQAGLPGTALTQPLTILVKDPAGAIIAGAPVAWEVVSNATLGTRSAVTDANGRATANVTLGSTVGPAQVKATSGTGTVTFSLAVTAVPTSLISVSGNGQSAIVGQAFSAPLVVQLRDANNAGVAGQTVNFRVASGAATLSSATAITNAQGQAQVTVTAGATAGSISVTATFGTLPAVTFDLTARQSGPVLTASSFVNGASGAPGVVPGGIVRIVGQGLAPNVQNCVVPDTRFGALPLELAQVSVQFGPETAPTLAPMFYVCNQGGEESVAVQVPFEVNPGTTQATIRVSGGSTTVQNIPVLQVQPGIFETIGQNNLRYGVVLRPNGTFASPQNPARRGEIVTLFATGLGRVDPAAATNSIGVPGQRVLERMVVGVNNGGVRVVSAEYAVNMIGVYAVSFEIPVDTAVGTTAPLALAADVGGSLLFANGSSIAIQ
jgi:uncharacterized protein (TIGR03437 family)